MNNYQEYCSIDRTIDYCISQNIPIDSIKKHLNICFSIKDDPNIETYIHERFVKIDGYKKHLDELLKIPKIIQRSEEWYKARESIVTASDFAQALGCGKFGTQKQFYIKKSGYEIDTTDYNNIAPLKWGTMFEPIAQDIYANRNRTKIHEFGLLKHHDSAFHYFGASPDGINEFGIMLEIKCPFKRKINGEVPLQYYYQIQGQLDVCDLDECDYLECEFEDQEYPFENCETENGLVIEYENNEYAYCPFDQDKDEWLKSQRAGYLKFHYWRLQKYNVIRVYRDKEFLSAKLAELKEVWDQVLEYRSDKKKYDNHIIGQKPQAKNSIGYCFI